MRAREILDWEPTISVEDGMRELVSLTAPVR
jgi:hypothetical protein